MNKQSKYQKRKQSIEVSLVADDILLGLAKGLLTASESRLVAAVLFLGQSPGQYTGTVGSLGTTLQVRFKHAYGLLKKCQKAGIISLEVGEFEPYKSETNYVMTVLPSSQWQT